MRFLAVLFLTLLLSGPANSAIGPEHKTCTSDGDCALVMVSCSQCCSTPSDFEAVNKQYQKQDQDPGVCTAEHIRACGVPECGLFTPEPYPVAVCSEGVCIVKVHPPDPRPQAPAPAPAAQPESDYLLDDVGGKEFALYPGAGYRSFVDPKYSVASLAMLENRVAELPAGTRIHWVPGLRNPSGKPLLLGNEANVQEFAAFCDAHKVAFEIAPPSCREQSDCAAFCKDAVKGGNCLPDGIPACADNKCTCAPICK